MQTHELFERRSAQPEKPETRPVAVGHCNGTFKADLDRGFAALKAG
jgi:hypothetical protein